MRETWSSDAAAWVENEGILDALFAPVTSALIAAADLRPGLRVLDVGCGTGTLLGACVERGSDAVGVDISPEMVAAASARVPAARVEVADAQRATLAPPFDRIVSRFGVMFFDDPVAAFSRLRAEAVPGGLLAFSCWRGSEENPMFTLGQTALNRRREAELGRRAAPDPAAPGPLSLADYGRVRTLLRDAGWSDVAVRPLDFTHDHGFDGTDGVETRLAVVLGTGQGRRAREDLVPVIGESGWAEVVDEVRAEIRSQVRGEAVRYPGACWLVTATNPGSPQGWATWCPHESGGGTNTTGSC